MEDTIVRALGLIANIRLHCKSINSLGMEEKKFDVQNPSGKEIINQHRLLKKGDELQKELYEGIRVTNM